MKYSRHWRCWLLIALLISAFSLAAGTKAMCGDAAPVPKEGEIVRSVIRFGEREWPLPDGDWEVLAYIPKVFDTGRSFRVALAKFDQKHEVGALVMFSVGEVGDLPDRGVVKGDMCEPRDLAFQGEQQIRDRDKEYTCWALVAVDLAHLPADHLSDVVRLKLQSFKISGTFPAIESVFKKNGLLANVFVWINSNELLADSSQAKSVLTAGRLWPDATGRTPDSLVGTRLSLSLLLREWAIRWQERVQLAVEARPQPKTQDAALPLPVLQNPRSNIPILPDMGLRQDMTFAGVIPIGPFLIPLPPGSWKVVIHNPKFFKQRDRDGEIAIDQATLVNVQDGVFHGLIQLESSLLGSTTDDHPCKSLPAQNLSAYKGPNEYCAVLNPQSLDANDAYFPLVQEMAKRGVRTPKKMMGSIFIFSNRLVTLHVFVELSPNHVGLPDVEAESRGRVPPEWTSFVPKWRLWTSDWAEFLLAGLTGTLSAEAIPAKWRDLDLKSERLTPVVQPKLGETYAGSFPFGGRNWPLPPGAWEVMALTPQISLEQIVADEIYLANLTKDSVQGIVALSFSRPDVHTSLTVPIPICAATPDYYNDRVRFDLGAHQDCWLMRINDKTALRKSWHRYEVLEAAVKARGLAMPELLLYSGFGIVDRDRALNLFYGVPPTRLVHGLKPSEADDVTKWSPKNGPISPVQMAAFHTMHDWARAWHDVVRLGFDGKLKLGPLPKDLTVSIPALSQ